MKKKTLKLIITLFIFIIGGIILLHSNCNKKIIINNYQHVFYEIVDESAVCEETLEPIYEDDNSIYYLSCMKSNNIFIIFSNGLKYSLNYILNNNLLSINDLIANGLDVLIKEKNVENNEVNNNDKETNNLLMTQDEIIDYNQKIRNKASMVYNTNLTNITKAQILEYINTYKLNLPKYNGNYTYTTDNTKEIIENRNISNIKDLDNIPKGIIVQRANLRSFPTEASFYNKRNIKDHDRLQETELLVNTPALIIHESKDKLWNFVITPFYVGWVKKDNIALTTDDQFDYFINNSNFGIIIEPTIKIDGIILDMSVKLPYFANNAYVLPIKDNNGYVSKKIITIESSKINKGFLPFTKENIDKIAKKYLGVKYSWGGKDEGVDCSSYVSNIYRTFGIYFPRNTSVQNTSVGTIISLKDKTNAEKLKIIENTNPSLLYKTGHVMLYLGKEGNNYKIIHANGQTMNVTITNLENSSYLSQIDKLVLIP